MEVNNAFGKIPLPGGAAVCDRTDAKIVEITDKNVEVFIVTFD